MAISLKKSKKKEQIITTIGVYADGTYVVNGVNKAHLQTHINYNKLHRPGRALIVGGEIIYWGAGVSKGDILKLQKSSNGLLKQTKCTKPYK